MTSTQIKVTADVSAVKAAIEEVNKQAAQVNQTLNAGTVGIDTSKAQKDLDALVNKVEELTSATKEAANAGADLDFDAVAKSAGEAAKHAEALGAAINKQGSGSGASGIKQQISDLNGLRDTIERVRKVQAVLAQEGIQLSRRQAVEAKKRYDDWRKSGAHGTGKIRGVHLDEFVNGGWRKMALAEIDARRFRRNVLSAAGIDASAGGSSAGTAAQQNAARTAREKKVEPRTLAQFAAGAVREAIGGVVETAAPGGHGVVRRITGRGITEAAASEGGLFSAGGIGRMAAGLGIGALAFGAVKAVGAVKQKVGDAEDEATAYTDLRHALGQTRTDFDMLRASLRDAAKGLGVANNEVVALGSQFARIAGMSGSERALGQDLHTSVSFSRSYGLDPSQGIGLFGTMRHFGVTQNDSENRRLAMMIGDAVGRSDSFARMPDMIAAVEGFTERAGRATIGGKPNVDAYLNEIGKLTGLRMNGLDTRGADGLLSSITNAWHAGGGFGQASQNFRLRAFTGALPGFDAYDLGAINSADPFSKVSDVFGKGSAEYQLAQSRHDDKRRKQLDGYVSKSGNRQLLDVEVDQIIKEYGNNTAGLRDTIARQYNVSDSQAAAWIASRQQGRSIGMTAATLTKLGIDPRSMNADYSALAQLNNANPDELKETARNFLKGDTLSPKLRDTLKAKLNGATDDAGNEELRRSLMQVAAMVGSPKDEGENVRSAVVDLKNVTQDMAAHLVPYTNDIRDGILALANKLAGGDDRLKAIQAREFSPSERGIMGDYDKTLKARDAAAAALSAGPKGAADALDKQIADFEREHTDRNTHALNLNAAQRAQYAQLKQRRAEAGGPDYLAKLQKRLDDENKRLADVRGRAAKAAENGGIRFKEWSLGVGDGADNSRIDAQNRLADHLGKMVGAEGATGSAKDFAKKYGPAAAIAAKALGVDPNVLLGQWGLETGWGRSVVPGTNNLGNIKDFSGGGVAARDNATGTLDNYRTFSSPEAFAQEYVRMVKAKYPGAVGAGGDARKFAAAMKVGGYAEDSRYVDKLVSAAAAVPSSPLSEAHVTNGAFGNMPLPTSAATALGPNGGMRSAMQSYAFDHKITIVDQNGRPRAAPVVTTVQSKPSPSGAS